MSWGTSLYWGDTPREVGSFADELKKNAPAPNCMKAFSGTFGSPAIMAFKAFDPWLCVTVFRQLCLFVGNLF
jgi:hypothetical protein